MLICHATALVALAAAPAIAHAATAPALFVPFDFSRGAIGVDVTVKGTPLYVMLDTGVDPSVIDMARATALGLKVDRGNSGEASGYGDAKQALIYPATIDGLAIGGRAFPAIDALATDMAAISAGYKRPVDAVLGYSFLTNKIVLIDYPNHRLGILDRAADAAPEVQGCSKHWRTRLKFSNGDTIPIIADFHFGGVTAPISLDTGSNGGIALYASALDLPGLRGALTEKGEMAHTGARGGTTSKTYTLAADIGFGPFKLPAGATVSISKTAGSPAKRVANIGNELFAAMHLKMVLDYRARQMSFYGDCPAR